MYKMVAIDLDGTLLNSYGHISEKNKIAINRLQDDNVEVVIASGRPIDSVKNFAKEIGKISYCICGNGSLLYDNKNEKKLYDKYINKKKALEIIKLCKYNSIYFNVYTENFILAESLKDGLLAFNNENQNKPENQQTKIKVESDVYKYIEENNIGVLKISASENNEIIFNRILSELNKVSDVNIMEVEHMSRKKIKLGTTEINMEYYYTEITSKNVDKWTAIEKLGEILNLENDSIVAIGDNVNDKQMILNSGLGIAMGNSADYIKNYADKVTLSNNEDGVAHAIEKYILA